MEEIKVFVILLIVIVGGGALIGAFFDWLSEKRAIADIKKHDAEVARKIRAKYLTP